MLGAVLSAVSDGAMRGYTLVSLSAKAKFGLCPLFGRKLGTGRVGLYLLRGDTEGSGKIQPDFSFLIAKALSFSQSLFV